MRVKPPRCIISTQRPVQVALVFSNPGWELQRGGSGDMGMVMGAGLPLGGRTDTAGEQYSGCRPVTSARGVLKPACGHDTIASRYFRPGAPFKVLPRAGDPA
jgi:hypothetical protein